VVYEASIGAYADDLFFVAFSGMTDSLVRVFRYNQASVMNKFETLGELVMDNFSAVNSFVLKLITPIAGTSIVAYTATEHISNPFFYNFGIIAHKRIENDI